jgi:hypothetical protein
MRSLRLLVVAVLAVVLALSFTQNAFAPDFGGGFISVGKVTTNGDTTTLFHFTLSSGGQVVGTADLTGGTIPHAFDVASGTFILQETVPSGWVLTDISCRYLADDVVSVGGNVFAAGSLGVASYEPADTISTWTVNLADHSVTIIFDDVNIVGCTFTNAPAPAGAPVGGIVEPVNKLAVFAPYLALLGVIATVAVIYWKRPDN